MARGGRPRVAVGNRNLSFRFFFSGRAPASPLVHCLRPIHRVEIVMGAGASTEAAAQEKNREQAVRLCSGIDASQPISIDAILEEVQKHGATIKAYWTRETIAAVMPKFDKDSDGKLTFDEFLSALNEMEANVEEYHGLESPKLKKLIKQKSRPATAKKRTTPLASMQLGFSLGPPTRVKPYKPPLASKPPLSPFQKLIARSPLRWPPQRKWVWKAHAAPQPDPITLALPTRVALPTLPTLAETPQMADGNNDKEGPGQTALSALEELEKLEVPVEVRKAEYLAKLEEASKQEPRGIWQVPMMRKVGAWSADGESGMSSAIAYARQLGLTPLLIDDTLGSKVETFWLEQGEETRDSEGERVRARVQIVDAASMLADEKQGLRTRALIVKEARLQLVAAMKHGQTFFVRIKSKPVDFTHYTSGTSSDPGMPWATVFDQRVWAELAKYTKGTPECHAEAQRKHVDNTGLWESGHPIGSLLKE